MWLKFLQILFSKIVGHLAYQFIKRSKLLIVITGSIWLILKGHNICLDPGGNIFNTLTLTL